MTSAFRDPSASAPPGGALPRLRAALTALTALPLAATALAAQTAPPPAVTPPAVYTACYVVATGTVYRINKPANSTPGAPAACGTTRKVPDVEFSWTDANGAYHTTLQGLDADDHPQYLLANGVRSAVDGFTVTGTFGAGTPLAVSGTGTRLLWYPRKAAFRAGRVTLGSMWDDANIGETSIALGEDTQANGPNAIAMGARSVASGSGTLALGTNVKASAPFSAAIGFDSRATGDLSIAMGTRASTNGQEGAFAIGDRSTTVPFFGDVYYVRPTAPNQFVARFANGYVLYTNSTHDAGVTLAPGGGAWQSVSDVRRKTAFRAVDGEDVLARLAAMPVRTWQYRAQAAGTRHMGPTAQDFRAAFALGESDTTITTVDVDGVALAAAQALEARTRALQGENAALRAELAALRRSVLALDGARRPPAPSRAASRRAPNVPGTPAAASRGTRPSPPPRPTSRSTS